MLRKIVFTLICLSLSVVSRSQGRSDCHNEFTTSAVAGNEEAVFTRSVTITYDFSSVSGKNAKISLEVVPVKDCWNEAGSKRFGEAKIFELEETAFKGSRQLTHGALKAKCFKWRFVIDRPGCREETPWTFQALIPNRN